MIRELPIASIIRRQDARSLNQASVSALAESIATVGMISPIRVREKGDRWEVSAGSHRLAACEMLGLADIECIVINDDDLHAELSMIDENLCRNELSPAERASQTARRKAIYIELHPETANGSNQHSSLRKDCKPSERFTANTASATGQSERIIQLNAERGSKVIPEVIELITGTKLDTGIYLDKLKRLPPNEQMTAVRRDLALIRQNERAAKPAIKVADAPLNDESAQERQVAALMSAWNKAGAEARQEFLERIEQPIFDRGAA
ncbi:ParB/RepB/Spo0J family partition protein [Rhizobium lusitanum]|uniref:ParB/RepB/Spo0J family partition protein n=1 Tax=Rhizobium lusitanum TaxID=293958 RepID=A0A1C3VRX2_9HYPH|nr:ParB/RepB/Spo0J family partition protein [Rhizobium lusitanum]SCB30522.1 ParB/RepB/Spo0J family partition protein [Rhizobium lusitanum]